MISPPIIVKRTLTSESWSSGRFGSRGLRLRTIRSANFCALTGVVVRRIDDLRKVRGILISPTEIERIVQEASHLGEHYQVILHTRDDSDEVTLRVESLPNTSPAQLQKMKRGLRKKFQERLLLRFNVEIVEYESLPRRADKAQKIIDQREIPPIRQ